LTSYESGLVTPETRATLVAGLFAAVPAVVLGLLALLIGGPLIGVIVLVVVGASLGAWARFGGERWVLSSIGGRDADPVSDARLCNLAEGLSISAGVRQPRLVVVDSTGLNAMAVGVRPSRAVVGVTAGLLNELDLIELEAVLAEELVQIRRRETLPATVLVGTFGIGRAIALPADRDAQMDQAAVALTRYPPALASALEKLDAKGAAVAGQPAVMAHLWLADPSPAAVERRGRLTLHERVEALREL
jgi:Zn-dependent protease with chaperone function